MSIALALLLTACTPSSDSPNLAFDGAGQVIEGEFVISTDLTPREMDLLDVEQLGWIPALHAGLYSSDEGVSVTELKRAINAHASRGGPYVEANRPVHAFAVNDPYRSYQWNFDMLDAETAWSMSTGAGATVAVVDTGVYTGGSDAPANILRGYDFVDDDTDPADTEGHGTHVAGTIAQATNNGTGVAGLAYRASILPVRVLGPSGGSTYTVANGIVYAVDSGADVINLSLGSAYGASVLADAIDYAVDHGVVVVAATGNESASSVSYPAAYDGVIGVGAVRYDHQVASYSNGGVGTDVVAPGGDMTVDQNGDGYGDGILQETNEHGSVGYRFYEGTSMATPHVAATAALLISAGADGDEVPGLITGTATDLGSSGWDSRSGYGLVNPVAALEAIGYGSPDPEADPEPEADTVAPTLSGVGGSRSSTSLTIWWTTDEPATSEIEIDGYGHYGDDSELVTEHELRFTVDQRSTYEFQLVSVDEAGNEGVSSWYVTSP